MNNIANRLKELREKNGLTRKEAVDRLRELGIDISDKTLYGYESGRNSANADMFLALCKIYNCNNIMETFSDTVDDVLFTNSEWELLIKYRTLSDSDKKHIDAIISWGREKTKKAISPLIGAKTRTRSVSYYQKLASAGSGEYLFADVPIDTIDVPVSDISEQADFVIGVNGDSMEPVYCDGDKVYVKLAGDIPIGHIGIFTCGNDCFIKELGADRLISFNHAGGYKDIMLTGDAINLVGEVLGKVEEL